MTEITYNISGQISLSYNEKSKEFKESLEGFRDIIEKNGSKESMLKHVAFHVTRFGVHSMVEGVGYVGFNKRKPDDEPYSGIMITNNDYDEFDFEEQ